MSALTALDWLIIIAGWFLLACPIAVAFGRSLRDQQPVEEPAPFEDDYPTAPIPSIPPVPSQHFTDVPWLFDEPLELTLTGTEVDLRLRDIEAAEGWVS